MRFSKLYVFVFLILASPASVGSAKAYMLGPADFFKPIYRKSLLDELKIALDGQVDFDPRFTRSQELWGPVVYASGKPTYVLIVVRFENMCDGEFCLSALFRNDFKKASLEGFMMLPVKSASQDTPLEIPGICRNGAMSFFVASDGSSKQIKMCEIGIIF